VSIYYNFTCRSKANLYYSCRSLGSLYTLKVHKIENFFGFDFEFCTISLLVMHK
jgi:hypothetical protein